MFSFVLLPVGVQPEQNKISFKCTPVRWRNVLWQLTADQWLPHNFNWACKHLCMAVNCTCMS